MFHIATPEAIKKGKITDVYFTRVYRILKEKGINKHVKAEVRASSLPDHWDWAVLAGVEEAARLLEGLKINLRVLDEGTIFHAEDPVLEIEGKYLEFCVYETSLLGLICQASGIATRAARCKKLAGQRGIYSFGARRMHPAISPMIERNAYIGGCDGVAVVESAELIGENPVGTMSHSLILCFGSEEEAYKAFDEVIEPIVPRVALIDTFHDEKFAAIRAAETLGKKLFAIRFDTPKSRRGDFLKILQEVRWELDLRGYKNVKIFLSGGINEKSIVELNPYTDAYGVGTYISNANVIDFSFDIIEIEGEPFAKRGKWSGSKQIFRCHKCYQDVIAPLGQKEKRCNCGTMMKPLLNQLIKNGKIIKTLPKPQEIRKFVMKKLKNFTIEVE